MKWVSEGADMENYVRGCVQCKDRNMSDSYIFILAGPIPPSSEFLDDKSCQVTLHRNSK